MALDFADQGEKKIIIARTLDIARSTVYRTLERRDDPTGLEDRSHAPHHRAGVVFTPLLKDYLIGRRQENPLLGPFRLKFELEKMGIRVGHSRIGDILREAGLTQKPPKQRGPHPFEPQYLHQYWFMDARYLIQLDTGWVYSIEVMEGFSRALLASAVTTSLELEPVLVALRSAYEKFGLPLEGIVLDGGPPHNASRLKWMHEPQQLDVPLHFIKRSADNLAEAMFGVQRRLLDALVIGCTSVAQVEQAHGRFFVDYQEQGHWRHLRKDSRGRLYALAPVAVLGSAQGRAVSTPKLCEAFEGLRFERTLSETGHVRLQGWRFYVESGARRLKVEVIVYKDQLRVQHQQQLLARYACVADIPAERVLKVQEGLYWADWVKPQLVLFPVTPYLGAYHRARRSGLYQPRPVGVQYALPLEYA